MPPFILFTHTHTHAAMFRHAISTRSKPQGLQANSRATRAAARHAKRARELGDAAESKAAPELPAPKRVAEKKFTQLWLTRGEGAHGWFHDVHVYRSLSKSEHPSAGFDAEVQAFVSGLRDELGYHGSATEVEQHLQHWQILQTKKPAYDKADPSKKVGDIVTSVCVSYKGVPESYLPSCVDEDFGSGNGVCLGEAERHRVMMPGPAALTAYSWFQPASQRCGGHDDEKPVCMTEVERPPGTEGMNGAIDRWVSDQLDADLRLDHSQQLFPLLLTSTCLCIRKEGEAREVKVPNGFIAAWHSGKDADAAAFVADVKNQLGRLDAPAGVKFVCCKADSKDRGRYSVLVVHLAQDHPKVMMLPVTCEGVRGPVFLTVCRRQHGTGKMQPVKYWSHDGFANTQAFNERKPRALEKIKASLAQRPKHRVEGDQPPSRHASNDYVSKLAGRGVDMKKLSGCMVQCYRADFVEWFDVEEGRAWNQETDVAAPQPGSLSTVSVRKLTSYTCKWVTSVYYMDQDDDRINVWVGSRGDDDYPLVRGPVMLCSWVEAHPARGQAPMKRLCEDKDGLIGARSEFACAPKYNAGECMQRALKGEATATSRFLACGGPKEGVLSELKVPEGFAAMEENLASKVKRGLGLAAFFSVYRCMVEELDDGPGGWDLCYVIDTKVFTPAASKLHVHEYKQKENGDVDVGITHLVAPEDVVIMEG